MQETDYRKAQQYVALTQIANQREPQPYRVGGITENKRNESGEILCWCGEPMSFVGFGAYPYDCIARRKRPLAAVYESVGHTHGTCWTAA